LTISFSQGSVATDLRGGAIIVLIPSSSFLNLTVKKNLVHVFRSYRENKSGTLFETWCIQCLNYCTRPLNIIFFFYFDLDPLTSTWQRIICTVGNALLRTLTERTCTCLVWSGRRRFCRTWNTPATRKISTSTLKSTSSHCRPLRTTPRTRRSLTTSEWRIRTRMRTGIPKGMAETVIVLGEWE